MRKKTITIIALLLFISGVSNAVAEDAIVEGEPVTVVDVKQEPVVSTQIYEGLQGFVDENGNFLQISSEDIDILNSFSETAFVIEEPAQSKTFKQKYFSQNSVCYLPITIVHSNGATEQTGIFTSPLTGSIATCVLPPADKKFTMGNKSCTLKYNLSNMIQCQPPATTGCCQVNVTLKLFWWPKPIAINFCYNSSCSTLCLILNKWLEPLGGSAVWTEGGFCNYEIKECEPDIPTAVAVASFTAAPANKSATLTWETGDETNIFGFNIYRAEQAAGVYNKINDAIIFAQGCPGTGANYIFVDTDVDNLITYYYKLESVFSDGSNVMSKAASATPNFIYEIMK